MCKLFTLLIYSLIVILLNFYEIIFRKLFTLLIYSTLSLSSTPSCNSLSNFSRLFQRKEFTIQNEIWGQYPILTSSYFGPILFHRDPNLTRSLFWCWTLIPLWPEMGPGNFATHCCRQICCVSHVVVQSMKIKICCSKPTLHNKEIFKNPLASLKRFGDSKRFFEIPRCF